MIPLPGRGWGSGTPEACSQPCVVRGQAGQGRLAPGGDGASAREWAVLCFHSRTVMVAFSWGPGDWWRGGALVSCFL